MGAYRIGERNENAALARSELAEGQQIMDEPINIESLLHWSVPVEVETRRGIERARYATPTCEFWGLWRERKPELKAAGIRVKKNRHTDRYVVYLVYWHPPPPPDPHWTDAA